VSKNRGYQIFLNHGELERNGVSPEDIAQFVRDYRVQDNTGDGSADLGNFGGPPSSRLFLTAVTPDQLPAAITCARRDRR
jgi:hypothetical protein